MKPMGKKSAKYTAKNAVREKIIAEREQTAPIQTAKIKAGRIQAGQKPNQIKPSKHPTSAGERQVSPKRTEARAKQLVNGRPSSPGIAPWI
jgi:hypothetical protein